MSIYTTKNVTYFSIIDNDENEIILIQKTCWDCVQRIGEECGIDGHEVYMDSEICSSFEES